MYNNTPTPHINQEMKSMDSNAKHITDDNNGIIILSEEGTKELALLIDHAIETTASPQKMETLDYWYQTLMSPRRFNWNKGSFIETDLLNHTLNIETYTPHNDEVFEELKTTLKAASNIQKP